MVVFYVVCVSWNDSAVNAVVKVNTCGLHGGLLWDPMGDYYGIQSGLYGALLCDLCELE